MSKLRSLMTMVGIAGMAACAGESTTAPTSTLSATAPHYTTAPASVVVQIWAFSLTVPQSVQAYAVVQDSTGATIASPVTWSSSNPAVATISSTGMVQSVSGGTVTINATAGTATGHFTLTVIGAQVPVGSVSLALASNILTGNSATAVATVKDANGQTVTNRLITFASSNPAVASVSSAGVVTGVGSGSAVITATSEGKSGSATISVATLSTVSVGLSATSITAGKTATATATLRDPNGVAIGGQTVVWTSSNTAVATVSQSGLVTGVAAGTANITATVGGKSGTAAVTVTAASGASVAIALSKTTLAIGDVAFATTTIRDANGNIIYPFFMTFSSSNPAVATVSAGGQVTGVSPGTAQITVSYNGMSASATVTVAGSGIASVTITLTPTTLAKGAMGQAIATFRDANGNVVANPGVTWTSSNPAIAPIAATGIVVGQSAGTVTITANGGGVTATTTLTVTP